MSHCLCLLTTRGKAGGTSTQVMKDVFEALRQSEVEPVLCTITGEPPAFYIDEGDEDWHYANKEILGRAELLSECSAAMFSGVVIPCAAGNCMDLAKDSAVGALLREFNLMDKPICSIGCGCFGLLTALSATDEGNFCGFAMTGLSLSDWAQSVYSAQPGDGGPSGSHLSSLGQAPETVMRAAGANFVAGRPLSHRDGLVIADGNLISAQAAPATASAMSIFLARLDLS